MLDQCLEAVMGWMRANKLKLNPDKMEALWIGGSQVQELDKQPDFTSSEGAGA